MHKNHFFISLFTIATIGTLSIRAASTNDISEMPKKFSLYVELPASSAPLGVQTPRNASELSNQETPNQASGDSASEDEGNEDEASTPTSIQTPLSRLASLRAYPFQLTNATPVASEGITKKSFFRSKMQAPSASQKFESTAGITPQLRMLRIIKQLHTGKTSKPSQKTIEFKPVK